MTVRRLLTRLAMIVLLAATVIAVCGALFPLSEALLRPGNTMTRKQQAFPLLSGPTVDALRASGWDRRASCEVDLDGTRADIAVRTRCDVSISIQDPLFPVVRAGELPQTVMFRVVVGLAISAVDQPVVVRHRAEERVTVQLVSSYPLPWGYLNGESKPLKVVGDTVEFDLTGRGEAGYRLPWSGQGAVTTRTMSVRLTGFTLVGISGGVPVTQDGSSATIEGPPGDAVALRMTVDDDSHRRPSAAENDDMITTEVLQPFVELMLPLLLLVVVGHRSKLWPFRQTLRFVWAVLGILSVMTLLVNLYFDDVFPSGILWWLSSWTFLCAVPLLVVLLVTRIDRQPRVSRTFHLYLIPPVAASGILVWRGFTAGQPLMTSLVLGCLVCAAACGGLAAGLLWGRESASVGLTLSLGAAAPCFYLQLVYQVNSDIYYAHGSFPAKTFMLLVAAMYGLCLYPLVLLAMRQLGHTSPAVSRVVAAVSALLLISVPHAIGALPVGTPAPSLIIGVASWAVVLKLMLLASFVPVLATAAKRRIPFSEPGLVACGATAIVIVLPGFETSNGLYDLLAGLVAVAIFLWLVPMSRSVRAARLAGLSTKVHNRLVRGEVRRRILRRAGTQFLRGSRADPVDWTTLGERYDEIDAVEHRVVRDDRTHVSASAAAFGSGGGQSRWESLRHGAVLAGLLSVPLIAYEAWVTFEGTDRNFFAYSTLEMLDYLRVALRWLVYGAVFGYFYTLVRGHDPVGKAIRLLVVLGVAETIAALGSSSETAWQLLLDVSVRLSLMVFFFLGLGLLWERHLARLASVPWNRVRDLRRGRSLVTPMTTVIVAGATVVVTALTSAAISPIVPAPPVFEQQDPLTTGQQK